MESMILSMYNFKVCSKIILKLEEFLFKLSPSFQLTVFNQTGVLLNQN